MRPLSEAAKALAGRTLGGATRPLLKTLSRRSLPKVEGETKLPGLTSPVEVLRDRFGVPQIFAGDEDDLFFAQGYVHAQDRFFQMELGRRAGHGRLSELLGGTALELDRLSRTVGLGKLYSIEHGPPEALRAVEAYAAGVNAYLSTGPRPPELLLLRHCPEPWTPADTAAWCAVIAWSLSAGWESELLEAGAGAGSNAWAVAPARSASGAALLAGDPHLTLGIPCLWYEVGLYGGPYDVIGASLPGSPGVVIGHNKEIAWSVTAALTDVQDLYVERFEASDRYKHAGEWREAEVREEEINVRGRRRPVVQRVRTTLHGPVISDLFDLEEEIALRWAAPEPLGLVGAGLALCRARNREEFLDALARWTTPNQNFVYADSTGTIGKALAGPVPVRSNHRGDRPVPGWDGGHEWDRFLPFEELPESSDPEEGYVASANEEPEGSAIPGAYLPGYRKRRIEDLLLATPLHTPETLRDIQSDLYCAPAHALAGRLAALDPTSGVPEKLLRELASWDGHLAPESRPGAVARVALEILLRKHVGRSRLHADSSLPTGAESYFGRLIPKLLDGLDGVPNESLKAVLEEAATLLGDACGQDLDAWSWGALHRAELRHPLGIVGPLRGFLNRGPYPLGGDASTVRLAAFSTGGPGRPSFGPVTTGPNYRFVVDTGDWEKAWSVVSPGQSGHPASANYDDQVDLWLNVRYRPMVFGREVAGLAAKHRLVLRPEKKE